jgi:hypothetical protein
MEPLTIKTPTDVLSFIGHTLGFWPQESLVCITLDARGVIENVLRRSERHRPRPSSRRRVQGWCRWRES